MDSGISQAIAEGEQAIQAQPQGHSETMGNRKPRVNAGAFLEDAGEKIGGARKDIWRLRGLSVQDLDSMSQEEQFANTTKSNVWNPDWNALTTGGGMPVEVAAFLKLIYDRIAAKPSGGSEERRLYIRMLTLFKEHALKCRSKADVKAISQSSRDAIGFDAWRYQYDSEPYRLFFSVNKPGARRSPLSCSWSDERKVSALVAKGWPAKTVGDPAYLKGFKIHRGTGDGNWFISKDSKIVADHLDSEAACHAFLKTQWEKRGRKPERPHLENIIRTMPELVRISDISSQELIDEFAFRGAEFGVWEAQDERQKTVNMAFESLCDLAEVMGMSRKFASLNGRLALAFGARGGGNAIAHYEPLRKVINITKLRGAGSLAHEFGHAIDHWLGDKLKPSSIGRTSYVSELRQRDLVGSPLKSAVAELLESINRRLRTRDEHIKILEERIASETKLEASYQERLRILEEQGLQNSPESSRIREYLKACRGESRIRALSSEIEKAKAGDIPAVQQTTDYKRNAEVLGAYWSRPTELFARAFECAIYDAMKAQGYCSQYLVHSVEGGIFVPPIFEGDPYPSGGERLAINAKMAALFKAIKWSCPLNV